MRYLPILLLFLAVGCTPESPERVAQRQFTNVRRGYLVHAHALLAPDVRQQLTAKHVTYDGLHNIPVRLTERVADLLMGTSLRYPDAYAFRVLETRVTGDTARLVVRRQWPDARSIMERMGRDGTLGTARDSFEVILKTRVHTPQIRRAYDAFRSRQTAAIIAAAPARFLRVDTATYVLARQHNVWRIVDDGGLLTAPVFDSATTADTD